MHLSKNNRNLKKTNFCMDGTAAQLLVSPKSVDASNFNVYFRNKLKQNNENRASSRAKSTYELVRRKNDFFSKSNNDSIFLISSDLNLNNSLNGASNTLRSTSDYEAYPKRTNEKNIKIDLNKYLDQKQILMLSSCSNELSDNSSASKNLNSNSNGYFRYSYLITNDDLKNAYRPKTSLPFKHEQMTRQSVDNFTSQNQAYAAALRNAALKKQLEIKNNLIIKPKKLNFKSNETNIRAKPMNHRENSITSLNNTSSVHESNSNWNALEISSDEIFNESIRKSNESSPPMPSPMTASKNIDINSQEKSISIPSKQSNLNLNERPNFVKAQTSLSLGKNKSLMTHFGRQSHYLMQPDRTNLREQSLHIRNRHLNSAAPHTLNKPKEKLTADLKPKSNYLNRPNYENWSETRSRISARANSNLDLFSNESMLSNVSLESNLAMLADSRNKNREELNAIYLRNESADSSRKKSSSNLNNREAISRIYRAYNNRLYNKSDKIYSYLFYHRGDREGKYEHTNAQHLAISGHNPEKGKNNMIENNEHNYTNSYSNSKLDEKPYQVNLANMRFDAFSPKSIRTVPTQPLFNKSNTETAINLDTFKKSNLYLHDLSYIDNIINKNLKNNHFNSVCETEGDKNNNECETNRQGEKVYVNHYSYPSRTTATNMNDQGEHSNNNINKKHVSFHEHVLETDVESGNSILKPIIKSEKI
jgi:hypothetical protein